MSGGDDDDEGGEGGDGAAPEEEGGGGDGKKPTASEHGGGRNASWRFSISAGCMSAPLKKEGREGRKEKAEAVGQLIVPG